MNVTEIVDLSKVSPQQTFLESYPKKPSATSTLYSNRFTTTNNDQSQDHTVVGVHIVLAKDDPNGLWDALHVDRNQRKLDPQNPKMPTRALRIYCDTLEVRGEFSVPEAEVSVFARRLVWATPDAAINTSPLQWSVDKAQNASGSQAGKDGAAGRNAGSFQLFVSKVESADNARFRLLAEGGRGQHPGAGKDGQPGKSMSSYSSYPFEIRDSGISTSKKTINFSPAAVYIDYEWIWGVVQIASNKLGADSFPESGSNALAPGIPGDGGNGGGLTTNLAAIVPTLRNDAGKAGNKERDYWGGSAGTPTSSAKYKVKLWHDIFGTNDAKNEVNKTDSKTTSRGTDVRAQGPRKGDGTKPQPNVISEANAWLHPLNLQKTLEYARDLFLAGSRDEVQKLLADYEQALAAETPPTKNKAWGADTEAQWTAAQSEVAAMMQRLRGHLDYFGNAAGYTPLLSLSGTVKLYEDETKRALRTLLLVGWVAGKEHDAKEAKDALGDAINALDEDTQQAADQVVSSESKIDEVTKRIAALKKELTDRGTELETLRTTLLGKAGNDLQQKARIKFAIKMAAAVCQVIPVGQPVLGTIGSLGSVAAGFVGGSDEGTPDTISKMGEVLKKASEAASKAKKAKEKAEKEKGKKGETTDAEKAKSKASGWATAGKGLGPALTQVSEGIKALQVPASEVEAEMQRLASESEEWKTIVKKINALNERKAAFANELVDALQSLGEGYARISSNSAAVYSMQQERAKQLGKLDPAATGFVKQMGQQSRLNLLKYLYLMVKSYETTVFKPINVDWKLTEIADKITALVKPNDGFDVASLDAAAKVLESIYQKNLETVRKQLLGDFSFNERTTPLQLGLSKAQTPEVLADLNNSGQVTIDPIAYGLVLSDKQLARLSNVQLLELELDPAGPQLPETTNLIVTLQPAHTGTMRKGEWLYSVYSDEPLNWSWTYLKGKVRESKMSEAAKDVLDIVLGKDAGNIRQKVSLPPVWSDLYVKVAYSPELPLEKRPRITRLYFEFNCDASDAPAHQAVLKVRSLGSKAGAIIECSPDLAKRADGFGNMIRIYSTGDSTQLKVPSHVAGAAFDAWDLIGTQLNRVGVKETEVKVPLDGNVLAQCNWRSAQNHAPQADIVHVSTEEGQKLAAERNVGADANLESPSEQAPPARDLPLRVEAAEDATVVGVAPTLDDAELLGEGQDGWKRINYRGIVGWVSA